VYATAPTSERSFMANASAVSVTLERSRMRTTSSFASAVSRTIPHQVFAVGVAVAAPVPASPPYGSPVVSNQILAPTVANASCFLTMSKTPPTARAPRMPETMSTFAIPTMFCCTTTSPAVTSAPGV